jgi:ribulose kinase
LKKKDKKLTVSSVSVALPENHLYHANPANVLNKPIKVAVSRSSTCTRADIYAAVAAGIYSNVIEAK